MSGNYLERRGRNSTDTGQFYRALSYDCKACPLRKRCIPPTAQVRTILIGDGFTALLRARRRKEKGWDPQTREKYIRHRWRVEGVHGRAKTQDGLARAVGRGTNNVSIQVYLTAAVMNLKKLAAPHPIVEGLLALTKRFTGRVCRSWTQWRPNQTDINKPVIYQRRPLVLT